MCIKLIDLFVVVGSEMAEVTKLLYIVVVDNEEKREKGKESFRYTRPVLQSTLQLMGCKARHAFKVCIPKTNLVSLLSLSVLFYM